MPIPPPNACKECGGTNWTMDYSTSAPTLIPCPTCNPYGMKPEIKY